MSKNKYFFHLIQGKSRYIIAVNNESWREQWLEVLNEAKIIADIIYSLKNYKRSFGGRIKKKILNDKEKKILCKYIK